jgi:hypothetical protein
MCRLSVPISRFVTRVSKVGHAMSNVRHKKYNRRVSEIGLVLDVGSEPPVICSIGNERRISASISLLLFSRFADLVTMSRSVTDFC